MHKFNRLPIQEINNSKNELELIDKTHILGKYNSFISTVFGIMKSLNLNKENSVILEAGSNLIGDSKIYFLSPAVGYFFANNPSIIDYFGFDNSVHENYFPLIKEQIEDNKKKCSYIISKDEMLENMKKQMIFSYESFQQKKEEIDKSGKNSVIISSFVLGSTFDCEKHFKNNFWNMSQSLQINRFALDDFVKNYIDEQEHNFVAKTPYIESEYREYIINEMTTFSKKYLKSEQDRISFLEKRLKEKYSMNEHYKIFDCPFEEGCSIAVSNTLK